MDSHDSPLKSYFLDLQRLRVHVNEGGCGPSVLMVHGAGGGSADFDVQAADLARYCHVYTIDLRGHGETPMPEDRLCAMEDFYLDLLEVVAALGLDKEPFSLVGHSFGGYLSARYAAEHQEGVGRLALLNTGGELPHGIAFRFLRHFSKDADTCKHFMPWLVTANSYVTSQLLHHSFEKWHCWDLYPQIKAPTLVVLGVFDPLIPLKLGRKMASLIPDCKVKLITSGGHLCMNDAPHEVSAILREHLLPGA